jgi:hypothetical protein
MPMREYIDPTGRNWHVWAVYPTETISGRTVRDVRAAGGWLAFQSGDERRRFYPPPPDWESLSEERIEALWRTAVVVASRPRFGR